MEKEDERKKRIKEYAEVLAYFIDNPDQLKNEVLKEYVAHIRYDIEKRAAEKQQQLSHSC